MCLSAILRSLYTYLKNVLELIVMDIEVTKEEQGRGTVVLLGQMTRKLMYIQIIQS